MQSHLFVKVLAKKPGWKDSNFQVEPPPVLEVLSAGLSPPPPLPLIPLLLLTLLLLLHSLSPLPSFQVMKAKLGIVALLAERAGIFGKRSTSCAMPALVEKLADVKVW